MAQERGLWPWLLQRITGLYLVFGMAVHIIVLPLGKETITFESVAARLRHPWWFVFDLVLLTVCVYHGFNGLWSVFLDFDPPPMLKRGIAWALILFGVIWTIFGLFVLLPFAT
jgi:succinate dehydrogenase hydrophobic membrane anchor protein